MTDLFAAPGQNCWRRSIADRTAVLIDGAAYFRAFRAAAQRARWSIVIVGWDVDSRAYLDWPDVQASEAPNQLAAFLRQLASRNPSLRIRILGWDAPRLYSMEREWLPDLAFTHGMADRIRYVYDSAHPVGGSQHQKLVVVDGKLAFAGGLDLSRDRLDSPEHRAEDMRRRNADGSVYGPFHDIQVAVDGQAALDLAALANDRWRDATGEELDIEPAEGDPWPDMLKVDFTKSEVAVARTLPEWRGRPAVREVARLHAETIARARRTIYLENQYLSSDAIADALIARLEERSGPEIVIVVPRDCSGWLEEASMGYRCCRIAERLRDADRHGRLRIYCPVVGATGDIAVKVHAKTAIVDGRWLRIGSANLNNRSMGLDSEVDLLFDTDATGDGETNAADIRDRLLGEHLDCRADEVSAAVAEHGSLIAAIEALRRNDGRTLIDYRPGDIDSLAAMAAEAGILDPDGPAAPERIADSYVQREDHPSRLRRNVVTAAALVAVALALGAAWRWGPLSDDFVSGAISGIATAFHDPWIAAAGVAACFVAGSLVVAPLVLMVVATGMFLDPLPGFVGAFAGSLLGAAAGYGIGRAGGRRLIRRFGGSRIEKLSRTLSRHGIVTMIVARNLPVAPFTVVNMVAGASHISFGSFIVGTALGMAPGIFVMTVLANRFHAVLMEPDAGNISIFVALLAVVVLISTWAWRRFGTSRRAAGPAR